MDYIKNLDLVLSHQDLNGVVRARLEQIKTSLGREDFSARNLQRRIMLLKKEELIKKRRCIIMTKRVVPLEKPLQKYEVPKYEEVEIEGFFLRFGEEAEELETGFGNFTVALVEDDEGYIHSVCPTSLRFIK